MDDGGELVRGEEMVFLGEEKGNRSGRCSEVVVVPSADNVNSGTSLVSCFPNAEPRPLYPAHSVVDRGSGAAA